MSETWYQIKEQRITIEKKYYELESYCLGQYKIPKWDGKKSNIYPVPYGVKRHVWVYTETEQENKNQMEGTHKFFHLHPLKSFYTVVGGN